MTERNLAWLLVALTAVVAASGTATAQYDNDGVPQLYGVWGGQYDGIQIELVLFPGYES